ncbi:MAG: glycosyltransferase family 2 protein [Verrucomicrobiota bacterium]|nr:glycosyltransferase family 2 protein [Verrucomicrobiota bacterium]
MPRFGIKALCHFFYLSTLSAIDPSSFRGIPEKPMVIIIASYNNSKWIHENLKSVFIQDYSNYRVIYIDDVSTDGTADIAESLIRERAQESRFTLIRNTVRKGGLRNLYEAISGCADEEIIVNLDGDDWFANPYVLKIVNKAYFKKDIWLTHGTMIEYPKNALGWSIPIPKKIIKKNAFRTYRCPSHLKTFYAWLFKKIDVEDLKFNGEFFPMTWDQAMMFPMLEMAGTHQSFISETLYVYNTANPINDNKVDPNLQKDLEKLIRSKPSYPRLQKAPH